MDDASRLSLTIVVLLLLCAAYFAVAETAFASVSRVKIRIRAERGEPKAVKAMQVLDNFDRALTDSKYDLFFGGEESVYSQVGGGDLFWGFKHNWRHYFSFMHNLHSGIVNDYALWAVVALALVTVFLQIVL